jgi:hypothetical protein
MRTFVTVSYRSGQVEILEPETKHLIKENIKKERED